MAIIKLFALLFVIIVLSEGYIYMPTTHTERKLPAPSMSSELLKKYQNYMAYMVRKQNQDLRDAHKKLKSGICLYNPVHCQVGDKQYYKEGEDNVLRLGRTLI
uniref:SCP domain-containing protein n=1 Tax=Rhabditophanes sp. KR3021 TaxID=114890 RepID=A0AC35U237_9BILA